MIKYLNIIIVLAVLAPITASADQAILNPTDDARVWELYPTTNYGNLESLTVGYLSGWFNTLIKFDLAPYSGTTVDSAYLRLYVYDSGGAFPTYGIKIATDDADWDEDTVIWDNRPGFYNVIPLSAPSVYDWWVIDVTGWVQDIVDGTKPNYGFQIYKDGTDNDTFYMRSKEATSDHPELELNYTPVGIESASLGNIKAAFR